MPFPLKIKADLHAVQRLLRTIRNRLPESRRQLIEHIARETLVRAIHHNPVVTGRSRAAWITPLEQLGGPAPPGWQGPHPQPAAIHEGTAAGDLQHANTDTRTDLQATNAVPYIHYLEYGATHAAPRAMARKALHEIRARLHDIPTHLLE